jgi:hypothetical protein
MAVCFMTKEDEASPRDLHPVFSGEAETSWRTVVANSTVRIPSHRAQDLDEPREGAHSIKPISLVN